MFVFIHIHTVIGHNYCLLLSPQFPSANIRLQSSTIVYWTKDSLAVFEGMDVFLLAALVSALVSPISLSDSVIAMSKAVIALVGRIFDEAGARCASRGVGEIDGGALIVGAWYGVIPSSSALRDGGLWCTPFRPQNCQDNLRTIS